MDANDPILKAASDSVGACMLRWTVECGDPAPEYFEEMMLVTMDAIRDFSAKRDERIASLEREVKTARAEAVEECIAICHKQISNAQTIPARSISENRICGIGFVLKDIRAIAELDSEAFGGEEE